MAVPIVTFGGVTGIETFRFVMSRGVAPGQGLITTSVISQSIPEAADLTISYNGATLTLTEVASGDAYVERSGAGFVLRFPVFDRRWKWQFSALTGLYNVREGRDSIKFEKTPQQLAALIFEAIHEATFDATALPNDARPLADWIESRGDLALDELLAPLGCDVAPNLVTGGVDVVKLGSGAALPADLTKENQSASVVRGLRPDRIQVTTAPSRYQCKFLLEAVGQDLDGTWVPIDDLSFTPVDGWEFEHPEDFSGVTGTFLVDGVDVEIRRLALEHVGRAYRIKEIVGGTGAAALNPPGFADAAADGAPDITDIEQLLPLLGELNDVWVGLDGEERPRAPRVDGWFDQGEFGDDDFIGDPRRWLEGFSIDRDLGIVHLSTWATFLDGDPFQRFSFIPAELYLTCVVEVDWVGLNQKIAYREFRDRVGAPADPLVFSEPRTDVIPKYTAVYIGDDGLTFSGVTDNGVEVSEQVNYYLDALDDRLQDNPAETASYADLLLVAPDGAIEQVEWTTDRNGVTTNISRFARLDVATPSWEEFRARAKRDRAAQHEERRAERRPAGRRMA